MEKTIKGATLTSHFTHDRRGVLGVEVFAVGTFTPSDGDEITITTEDLDAIVAAFDSGNPEMVPVKFGHTSSAFNVEQAAELLGITPGLITGEGEDGDGAILPGTVTKLVRHQSKLLADFDVIAPVADMIADGLMKGISIELGNDNVMSAITLLGAQRPAVKDLVPLQAATVLSESRLLAFSMNAKRAKVARHQYHTAEERLRVLSWIAMDLGLDDEATIDDVITRLEELKKEVDSPQFTEDEMDEKAIRDLLGIGAGSGEASEIVDTITALKDKSAPKPSFGERLRSHFGLGKDAPEEDVLAKLGDPPDPATANLSEVDRRFKEKDAQIAALQRDNDVRRFAEQTRNFSYVQGTPEELATRLVDIKTKMGDEAVTVQLSEWEMTQELGKAAGLTARFGSHAEGAPGDWDAALLKWKADNPREKDQSVIQWDAAAVKGVSAEQPALYKAYYEEHRISVTTSPSE